MVMGSGPELRPFQILLLQGLGTGAISLTEEREVLVIFRICDWHAPGSESSSAC